MKMILITMAAAGALAVGVVQVQVQAQAQAQAQAQDTTKKCMVCHDMEKKKVGPSFKDATAKNKGNKDAASAIVAKMKDGKGHPKVAGSDDELKAAVDASLAAK